LSKFDYVLFDLDKTLFDFDTSEKYSLDATLKRFGYQYNKGALNLFQKINRDLWGKYDKGEIAHSDVKYGRFLRLFDALNISGDHNRAGDTYVDFLGGCNELTRFSLELCELLFGDCTLAIVTNGFSTTQHKRLKHSPITPYFDYIFISDEIGAQKPNIAFFNHVFKVMDIKNKEKAIIIGDSLKTDIMGGQNAGIKTCWFNPTKTKNRSGIKPDFEVYKLEQVIDIVI